MNKFLSLETAYPQGQFEGSRARKWKIIPHSLKEDSVCCSESSKNTLTLLLFHQLNCASRALEDSQHGWSSYL